MKLTFEKKALPLHGRADFYTCKDTIFFSINHKMMTSQRICPVNHFLHINTQSCLFVCEAGRYIMESSSLPLGAADLGIPCHMYLSMSLWMFLPVDIPHGPRVGLYFAAFYRQ